MYEAVLVMHSWLRWVVVVLAVVVLVRAGAGLAAGRAWEPKDRRFMLLLTIGMDVQLLLGLLLYGVLSPVTSAAFSNMGAAMKDPVTRFWAVEHLSLMVLAVAAVHVGSVLIRKRSGVAPHKVALASVGVMVVGVLLAIPWPFVAAGRPLLRM